MEDIHACESIRLAPNIIIDYIDNKSIWGWMDVAYKGMRLICHFIDGEKPLDINFHPREDMGVQHTGFHCQIPSNILLKPSEIINNNIWFKLESKPTLRVPIWPNAFLRYALTSMGQAEFIAIYDSVKLNEMINRFIPIKRINDVQIGPDGFLFGNINFKDEATQLKPDSPASHTQLNKIAKLITHRALYCNKSDIRFLQLLFPEKSSIFSDLGIPQFAGTTYLYKKVSDYYQYSTYFLDMSVYLHEKAHWCKGDENLNCIGAFKCTQTILQALQLQNCMEATGWGKSYFAGDLLLNLLKSPTYMECMDAPSAINAHGISLREICTYLYDAPETGHPKSVRKFVSKEAPFQQKILIFGNSFFGKGEKPTSLTWYFAKLFSKCIFYWTYEFNIDIIDAEKPDIILCGIDAISLASMSDCSS